jgi:hypothetical protein
MSNGSSKPKEASSPTGPQAPLHHQNNPPAPINARTERYRQFSSGVSSNGGGVGNSSAARMGSRSIQDDEDAGGAGGNGQPTPLFERLVTEEVQELKAYARIIETQQRRLAELELVHGDLERRLEVETKVRQQLEATLESREREWMTKFSDLQSDRDQWKEVVTVEQTKNARLRDQLNRKEKDIHQMLQRKVRNDRFAASFGSQFLTANALFSPYPTVRRRCDPVGAECSRPARRSGRTDRDLRVQVS